METSPKTVTAIKVCESCEQHAATTTRRFRATRSYPKASTYRLCDPCAHE